MTEKQQLRFNEAKQLIEDFCVLNNIKMCPIHISYNQRIYGCGYYENGKITVLPKKCAKEMEKPTGYCYSHPHYFTDRTIYGVLCHEFGHYVHDLFHNIIIPGGKQITSYEPNYNERFAETMKLFLSNPDLLKQYNSDRYNYLTINLGLKPVITKTWQEVMKDMNPRFIELANKKINK